MRQIFITFMSLLFFGCSSMDVLQSESSRLYCGNRYQGEGFYLINADKDEVNGPHVVVNDVAGELKFGILIQSGYKHFTFLEPNQTVLDNMSDFKYYDSKGARLDFLYFGPFSLRGTFCGPRDYRLIKRPRLVNGIFKGCACNTYSLRVDRKIQIVKNWELGDPPPPVPPAHTEERDEAIQIPSGTARFTFRYSAKLDYYIFDAPEPRTQTINIDVICNLKQ